MLSSEVRNRTIYVVLLLSSMFSCLPILGFGSIGSFDLRYMLNEIRLLTFFLLFISYCLVPIAVFMIVYNKIKNKIIDKLSILMFGISLFLLLFTNILLHKVIEWY